MNFAQSVVSFFAILASLGISSYAIREVAKVRKNRNEMSLVATEIFVINMIATVVAYILLVLSLLFVKKFEQYVSLILICSSLIMFTTIGMNWLYQAVEDYFYITVRSLFFSAVKCNSSFYPCKIKRRLPLVCSGKYYFEYGS